jgi:DNA-binding transcriptional LysR family regulator
MIDLSRLTHFVALARAGSFVRAAEELHLSQPALSRSIQALERQYGVTLFDRGRAGVTLTPFGRQVLARAEDLLFNADSLERAIAAEATGVSGAVGFGISPNAANVLLPSLLLSLFGEYPDVRVKAVIGSAGTLIRQLLDGEIEFFISRRDPSNAYDRIDIEKIADARVCFLVREGHPLASQRRRPVPLTALAHYPRLSVTAWNEALASLASPEVRELIRATVEVDNFELLADVAARSDAILISSYGHAVNRLVQLAVDESDLEPYGSEVAFFTLRGRTRSPASEAVAAMLRGLAAHQRLAQP